MEGTVVLPAPADETATLGPLPSATLEVGIPTLVVVSAGEESSMVRLDRPVVVGRGSECDLVLADSSASRRHVRLRPVPEGVEIEDLGSRNGTFLDGRRIPLGPVRGSAVLRVGQTLLRLAFHDEPWQPAATAGPLVGGSALALVRRQVRLVGPTDLPALLLGETGTGKDVVARMLHEGSGRSGSFLAVNCAALPDNLVESELFGHLRGAFTGAEKARTGLFVAASGGTLFLDEVGELPLSAQAKLLRVLEDGLVRPVGSEKSQAVDVRVISATNRDLSAEVKAKRFRADLLARLGGVEIHLPSLRDRPEDLPALARFLMDRAQRPSTTIEPDALEAMMLYEWPMNVRELESVLRTATLEASPSIDLSHLPNRLREPFTMRRGESAPDTRGQSLRPKLEQALRAHGGNVRRASLALGLSRSHIYRLLTRFGIEPQAYRKGGTSRASRSDDTELDVAALDTTREPER